MYSEEFDNNMSYNDEQYVDYDYQQEEQKPSFWNENKGLIIKIIIIVLCVLILIWLFLKIRGNNSNSTTNGDSMVVYNSNIDTMRLALEKYFFIDGNMPKDGETSVVTLSDLNGKGYIGEVVDANNKSCDVNKSTATLYKDTTSYVMTINLTCGSMSTPKVYNYGIDTKACLNCTGFTYMDGTTNNESTDKEENENKDESNDETTFEETLSCKVWSDWTDKKLDDDLYDVRTRVLVKGIKKGGVKELITYSDWSEYTTNVIVPSANTEVEVIVKTEEKWETKTSDKEVVESDTIRNVKKETTSNGSYSYCPKGYTKENKQCVKYSGIKVGNLTYVQYNTYKVLNKPCDGPFVEDGKTIIKNCQYQIKEDVIDLKWGTSYKTTYTYEELTKTDVTYYRSRTKTTEVINEETVTTDDYMEEKDLPEGYVKLEGSEKTEYSYKLKVCEK